MGQDIINFRSSCNLCLLDEKIPRSVSKIFSLLNENKERIECSMNTQNILYRHFMRWIYACALRRVKIKKYTTMNKWVVTKWFSCDSVKECCSLENENIHNITNCDMLYTSYKTTTKREDGYCIVRYNQTCQLSFHLISQITALTCSHIKKDCESAAKANICCFAVYYIWI